VQAAVKTLEVLFAFRGAGGPLGAADVAQRLGMTRSQAYRCLKTLEAVGVVREEARGFTLTGKLLELVPAMTSQSLLAVAEPLLIQLRDETGETTNLAVPVDVDEVHVVASYQTSRAIGMLSKVGNRSYLHAGSVPKAMLAFMPLAEIERFLAKMPDLPRYTPNTDVDPAHLREELRRIRARGYSLSDQDYEESVRGVGAPVFGPDGAPIAGVSVGGPASRIDDATLDRFGRLTVATAGAISQRLGHGVGRTAGARPRHAAEVADLAASPP
jgi:DNA-binding IclR family transcriptional regulator